MPLLVLVAAAKTGNEKEVEEYAQVVYRSSIAVDSSALEYTRRPCNFF